ncbi:hypothetical protein Tco_0773507 [Tanacetum coccineum]|uniref:Uncharacterized protein n=1 Tax=Tanacetum coccineum TaxID=301880 RepID=A0ABQ4ZNI9_9ASTR
METKDTLSSCSNSEEQHMQQIQDKAKESCMVSFRRLHSHLKLLSNNYLNGTRTESGFKRAFATLFGQDIETFTGTMLLNVDQLEKQLDEEEFQEIGSMAAFNVLKTQFQMFIKSWVYMDDEYVTTEDKVDSSKTLDASLVDTESSGTALKEQDTSSRSGNDAHADNADIIPIYDEEPMAENIEQCHDTCPLPANVNDNQTTELKNQSLEFENICLKKTVAQFQKDFLRMEAHCVNLELKYQNQALKERQHGQFSNVKSNEATVKHDIDVLETINIELEHKVAKLPKENETLKGNYKEIKNAVVTNVCQFGTFLAAAMAGLRLAQLAAIADIFVMKATYYVHLGEANLLSLQPWWPNFLFPVAYLPEPHNIPRATKIEEGMASLLCLLPWWPDLLFPVAYLSEPHNIKVNESHVLKTCHNYPYIMTIFSSNNIYHTTPSSTWMLLSRISWLPDDPTERNSTTRDNVHGMLFGVSAESTAPVTSMFFSELPVPRRDRCDEKIVRIPFDNEILTIQGDRSDGRSESRLNITSCTKTHKYLHKGCHVLPAHITEKKTEKKSEEKLLEDVPIMPDFPEVFPEDFPGLPPTRQVEFQID